MGIAIHIWFPVKENVDDEVVIISKDVADIVRKHVSDRISGGKENKNE